MAEQKRKSAEIGVGHKSPEPKQKLRRLKAFWYESSKLIFEDYPEYKDTEKDDFKTPEKQLLLEKSDLSGTGSSSCSASRSSTTESPGDSVSSSLSSAVSDAISEVIAELPLFDTVLDFCNDSQEYSY